MVDKMNFYITAEPRHMNHLHAFYVAGRIVAHPSVNLKFPAVFREKLERLKVPTTNGGKETIASAIMYAHYAIKKEPEVDFQLEVPVKNSDSIVFDCGMIKAQRPYTGDSLKISLGPLDSEPIQYAHDEFKKFIEEAEERLPQVEHIGGVSHFHVTVTPNPKNFKDSLNVASRRVEKFLSDNKIERTGEIVHFDVCGFDGYRGRICGLSRGEIPYGVIEWRKGDNIGNEYYIHPLKNQ
jgi:hypothetical protein